MTRRVGFATDRGRSRENNEDSLLVMDLTRITLSRHSHVGLYLVSDGIGGEASGEVASRMTVTIVARAVVEDLLLAALNQNPGREAESHYRLCPDAGGDGDRPQLGDMLRQAVASAHRAIHAFAEEFPENFGMGATLTAALMVDEQLIIGHVGDSRCYVLTPSGLEPVTEDHTIVGQMIRGGDLTLQEALRHPLRNVLYRSVGGEIELKADIIERQLQSGNRVLLCSDGLTGMVADGEIEQALRRQPDPARAVEELVEAANRAGGRDNISAILVDLL